MSNLTPAEFEARLAEVTVHCVDGETHLNHEDQGELVGVLSFTEGLKDLIGYELVAFGAYDAEDLLSSAHLIHHHFPRGVALPIPFEFLLEADPSIPEGEYRQFVVDESALEDAMEAVSSEPLWVPDGGYSLLPTSDLEEHIKTAMQKQEQLRYSEMEIVRDNYRRLIKEHGWAIVGVFNPELPESNLAYTVGLTLKNLPELVLWADASLDSMQTLLNGLAQLMIDGKGTNVEISDALDRQVDGEPTPRVYAVRTVDIDPVYATENAMLQASPILKQPIARVCQVQISDSAGRFFGDEGFQDEFAQVQIGPIKG